MRVLAAATAALALASGAAARAAGRGLQQAPAPAGAAPGLTDADILVFALNLEYLEGSFYSCATTGAPLPASVAGSATVEGCAKGSYTAATNSVLAEIASNEKNHVMFLRSALSASGVTPPPSPPLNLTFLQTAADLAVGQTLNPPFLYTTNDLFGYLAAYVFEDVGVTAYNGAIPDIMAAEYVSAAASILAIEAYHAGAIRKTLFDSADVATPYGPTVADVANAISALRGKLTIAVNSATAPDGDDQGITTSSGAANIIPADSNSLAFLRTVAEVTNIVSGFFPAGLSGLSS
eukprot:jgi/Astpho2/3704/Aster-04892